VTTNSRRAFLRIFGGALTGAAVVATTGTALSRVSGPNDAATWMDPPKTAPEELGRTVTFPDGPVSRGSNVPAQVSEAGTARHGSPRGGIEVIWQINTQQKLCALTFDDGPVAGVSELLYDALDEADIPATLFLVGKRLERAESWIKDRDLSRHEIGNHTYTHESGFTKTDVEILADLKAAHLAIERVLGVEPRLFRPPLGHVNGGLLVASAAMGYDLAMWSGYIGTSYSEEAALIRDVLAQAAPGGIFLSHDADEADLISIRALPGIVAQMKAEGYEFVTVSQMREATGAR
jgi:peptidoglycan/xylan/chitin deacetylase (PgdA/CDA1 family)